MNMVLIGTKTKEGKVNYMACAWNCYVSFTPALYGVSVAPERFTHEVIKETGKFTICFLPLEDTNIFEKVGNCCGAEVDKVKKFGLKLRDPIKNGVPGVQEAYCIFECSLLRMCEKLGDHTMVIGRIVNTWVKEERKTMKNGLINLDVVNPSMFMGFNRYTTSNKKIFKPIEEGNVEERTDDKEY